MTTGTEGNDNLTNNRSVANEVVDALGGDDTITVLTPTTFPSSVTVNGGSGYDRLIVSGTFRSNSPPSGYDGQFMVRKSLQDNYTVTYTSIERLELSGQLYMGTGERFTTGPSDDILHFSPFLDGMTAQVWTGAGNDQVYLSGHFGNAVAVTEAGDDLLSFLDLTGGSVGAYGGMGDDVYEIGAVMVSVFEGENWGIDTVRTTQATYALPANVENLTGLLGTRQGLTGNELNNVIIGNAGNDTLTGLAGDDVLTGNQGADGLDGGQGSDTVDYSIEAGSLGVVVNLGTAPVDPDGHPTFGRSVAPNEAIDTYNSADTLTSIENVRSGANADYLYGSAAANRFESGGGNDRLEGAGGDDWLDGGAGADRMAGGTGNDIYFVDDAGDIVVENAGEGTDEVRTSLAAYSLLDTNIENLRGTSNAGQTLTGSTGDNVIVGAGGADILTAGRGGDTLTGGAGADRFTYTHVYDSFTGFTIDQILDFTPGTDKIDLKQIDTSLDPGDQDFTWIGTAGFSANGTPAQLRVADMGGNLWRVEGDLDGNGTADFGIWVTSANGQPLTFTDFEGVTGGPGGGQTLIGTDNDDTLTGGPGDDRIEGRAGNDILNGAGGNDILDGGRGGDTLTGGAGADTFAYTSVYDSFVVYPVDQITDFTAGTDKIDLSGIDTSLDPGDQSFTFIGTAAFSGDGTPSQLRVEDYGGNHWRVEADMDGNGTVEFAIWVTTDGHPLTAADFIT